MSVGITFEWAGGITLGTRVRAVRFNDVEDAENVVAASAALLSLNAWVRRACREAAALEAAVAVEDVSPRVVVSERSFTPDFKR